MDNLTEEQRHRNMKNIHSRGTIPENKVMKELKRQKIYFSSHASSIYGTPDIVFRRKKVVVFIDSDFWHGHPVRFIMPKSNREYWERKISRNRLRDKLVTTTLRHEGWKVVRLWEFDIDHNFKKSIQKILKAIEA